MHVRHRRHLLSRAAPIHIGYSYMCEKQKTITLSRRRYDIMMDTYAKPGKNTSECARHALFRTAAPPAHAARRRRAGVPRMEPRDGDGDGFRRRACGDGRFSRPFPLLRPGARRRGQHLPRDRPQHGRRAFLRLLIQHAGNLLRPRREPEQDASSLHRLLHRVAGGAGTAKSSACRRRTDTNTSTTRKTTALCT